MDRLAVNGYATGCQVHDEFACADRRYMVWLVDVVGICELIHRRAPEPVCAGLFTGFLDFDFYDIGHKPTPGLIARRDNPCKTIFPKRLPVHCIGHHDLRTTKIWCDFASTECSFITVASSNDDDLAQDVVFDVWIDDNTDGLQKIPKQCARK